MAEETKKEQAKVLLVTSSPHLSEPTSSRRVMYEVVIGLLPAVIMSIYLFRGAAAGLLIGCVGAGLATEWLFNVARKKPQTIGDGSVIVTALILALSLPPTLPIRMAVVGMAVAVAVAKMLFGGLGSNIFNPAMVGRAFLMASFGLWMTTWTLPVPGRGEQTTQLTQATPLALAKQAIKDKHDPEKAKEEKQRAGAVNMQVKSMFLGNISGSLGETSALIWLIGGVFLLVRRTITYHIPLAVLGSAAIIALIAWLIDPVAYANPHAHLCGGGLMMGAFFIATDPVTCPLSMLGRVIFGIGVGALIMLIRLLGGYPEGVMYAVLLMNSVTPLLDRWTRPMPLGGHVRAE